MKKKKSGISLIVLVITIIVIIILAVAVILSIANNNPIENANKAKFQNDLKTIQEELTLKQASNYVDEHTGKTVEEITPDKLSSAAKYNGKIKIKNGILYINSNSLSEKEVEWAKEIGITEVKVYKLVLTEATSEETAVDGLYVGVNNILKGKYNGKEQDIQLPDEIEYFDEGVFSDNTSITSIIIPEKALGMQSSGMFENCTSLTSVKLPSKINTIGKNFFKNCTSLTDIIIPDGCCDIGEGAFENCTSLTNIVIPDSIVEIYEGAFKNCTSLLSINIPSQILWVNKDTFNGCTSLTNITFTNGCWQIGESAFANCTALKDLFIPKGISEINSNAFQNCTSLTNITLEKGSTLDPADAANWGVDTTKCTVTKLT